MAIVEWLDHYPGMTAREFGLVLRGLIALRAELRKDIDDHSGLRAEHSQEDLDAATALFNRLRGNGQDTLDKTSAEERELLWLAENQARYDQINAERDAGRSVASFEKEFVASYDRRRRAAINYIVK